MKKIGAVAGVIALAACWPFATGKIGQTLYFDVIGHYQNPYVTLKNVSYQRGYLNSTVITEAIVKPEFQSLFETEGLPTHWEVDTQLHHGFFSYRSESTLADTMDTNAFIQRLWGGDKTPIRLDTTTSLLGNTDFHLKIDPFVIQQAEGVWHIAPVTATGNVTREGQTDATLMVPRANYQSQTNGIITLHAIDAHIDGHKANGLWIGDQTISLGDMSWLDSATQAATTFTDLRFESINHLSDGANPNSLITNDNQLHIRRIQNANGETFNNLNIKVSLADINYPALSTLSDLTHQFTQPWTPQNNEQAQTALGELVKSGLRMSISECQVSTPQGIVSGNMALAILKDATTKDVAPSMMSIIKQLKGNLTLSVPVSLVDATPMLKARIQPLLKQGILEQEGGDYTLNVILKGDTLILSSGMQVPVGLMAIMLM